ncbi:MAG: hypothetical protein LQ345_000764 [Seirophora villosa]|nr:MAG: hypothetical protein LQ345_000764 [Seirophora villosa]
MLCNPIPLLLTLLPVFSTATKKTTQTHSSHEFELQPPPVLTPQPLNITTLTGNAARESIFECWSVSDLRVSTVPGIQGALVGSLAPGSALNYFNIPAKFDGGLHNAPVIQLKGEKKKKKKAEARYANFANQITKKNRWVYFTSGLAVISLPASNAKATTIRGGANGLILAADIANVSTQGHTTVYPGKTQTVGLTIPLVGNRVPEHTVLHPGPCTKRDQDV